MKIKVKKMRGHIKHFGMIRSFSKIHNAVIYSMPIDIYNRVIDNILNKNIAFNEYQDVIKDMIREKIKGIWSYNILGQKNEDII